MNLLLFNLAVDQDDPVLGFNLRWIEKLAEQFDCIDVITMRVGRYTLPPNVSVYSIGANRENGKLRKLMVFYATLLRLMVSKRYGACFSHMMPLFVALGGFCLMAWQIPVYMWYCHSSTPRTLKIATWFSKIVFTASANSFRLNSSKKKVIGHGIDTEIFKPGPTPSAPDISNEFQLICVGRICPSKRIESVIEAVSILKGKYNHKNVVLKILGSPLSTEDQAYLQRLKKLATQLELDNIIRFIGGVKHSLVREQLISAHCLISASGTGSIDKVVLEAMSCGVPSIAPPVFRDIFTDNLEKVCISHHDPKELAERIDKLIKLEPQLFTEVCKQSRDLVMKNHSLTSNIEKIQSTIRFDSQVS